MQQFVSLCETKTDKIQFQCGRRQAWHKGYKRLMLYFSPNHRHILLTGNKMRWSNKMRSYKGLKSLLRLQLLCFVKSDDLKWVRVCGGGGKIKA